MRSPVVWLLQVSAATILDNPYVAVSRNAAPCALAGKPGCGDRVVVALGPVHLATSRGAREMTRGDIAVFKTQDSYTPPAAGDYLEVVLKPVHPPVRSPAVLIPPEKNSLLYDGDRFFIFEEKLPPGETRARHSHSQRLVVVLNETRLEQWPDGAPHVFRNQVPGDVHFNEPVIHVVKTVGNQPLRNIVIEFKTERSR